MFFFRGSVCHFVTCFLPFLVWLPSWTLESFFSTCGWLDSCVQCDLFVMLTWHQCLRPYFSAVFFTRGFIKKWQVVQNAAVCLPSISYHNETGGFLFVLSSYPGVSCIFFKVNLQHWFGLQNSKLLWICLLCSWLLLLCYYATVNLADVLFCLLINSHWLGTSLL